MPKRPRVDRPVEKAINIPQSTCVKVDLLLFSELEQKVPHGAWSRYINGLIEADLACRAMGTTKEKRDGQG
jgi:hypothetical protein